MLTEKEVNVIVGRLATGKFVNGEVFSLLERNQILRVWRKHEKHPDNEVKENG